MKKLFLLLLITQTAFAQNLKPGFDKNEYTEFLRITVEQFDSVYQSKFEKPKQYQMVYRSKVIGMDNRWELWWNEQDKVALISLRGTTLETISWIENFYAAMVPATGIMKLNDSTSFSYKLAENDRAAVHVGWLTGMAYIATDLMPHLDSCIQKGVTQFIVSGHSQGGALTFLLTSHLRYLQKQQRIPAAVQFKSYCSAAPKPGNLYYAYDYETITQGGWSYTVVNTSDWVPETPISIQTADDFNPTNPFVNAKDGISKQKFPNNLVMKYVYNSLDKPTKEARDTYQKYLGKEVSKIVQKHLVGYSPPTFYNSNNYMRVGPFIILNPDAEYAIKFPEDPKQIFRHHLMAPYLYLIDKWKE
ncbi:MAG: lipase family protein [Bacteroidota bacterium]